MKKIILLAFCGLIIGFSSHSQVKASDVFEKLSKMPDQFDNVYDAAGVEDVLTIIYIPGKNNPFEKIYLKQKMAKSKENVLLVGGFKEMMKMMSYETKKDHLQEALSIQYKKGSTVLIDMDSELGELLSIDGYSIVTLSKKQNKVLKIEDYDFDRVKFFKELKEYESEKVAN